MLESGAKDKLLQEYAAFAETNEWLIFRLVPCIRTERARETFPHLPITSMDAADQFSSSSMLYFVPPGRFLDKTWKWAVQGCSAIRLILAVVGRSPDAMRSAIFRETVILCSLAGSWAEVRGGVIELLSSLCKAKVSPPDHNGTTFVCVLD